MLRTATLALVAGSAARAAACVVEAEGHPTVDLTPLALTDQDYSVASHTQSGYDYVVNVCSQLNFVDETCTEGSAVCQRHKHTSIMTDVYGYAASAATSWNDPDGSYSRNSSLVMTMEGSACGATGNTTSSKATIVFVCSNKEFLLLESEQLEKCEATFVFFTAQACGGPRYSCFNGTKCVESDDYSGSYGTYDKCAASCSSSPRYACVQGDGGARCAQKPDGPFADENSCSADCGSSKEE